MAATHCIMIIALFVTSASASLSLLSQDASLSLAERPVMKVVRLLQDMKAELQKELDDDKEVYETLACWCSTNEKEKTSAIELAEARIEELKSTMSEAAAKVVELKEKLRATKAEINADFEALNQASALRMKENKEFHASETDHLAAIQACQQAIVVLSKHNPGLTQVRSVVHGLQETRVSQLVLSSGALSSGKLQVLKEWLQGTQSATSFLGIPGFQSYAPRSGQIFGILKQLQEDFEANLSAEQQTERKAQQDFDTLKAAKEEEIASGKKLVAQLDEEIADLGEKAAQAAQEFEDVEAQLALDKEFLANLKRKCAQTDEEFAARTKSRLEELAAVDDTIAILNSDDAFDAFGKTVNTAFLQRAAMVAGEAERAQRLRAVSVIQGLADRSGSPQLAMLATAAQLDSFVKVKAAIDQMVVELSKQQQDEVAHRDWCTADMNKNARDTAAGYDKKAALETKIGDLKKTIEALTAEIVSTKASIAEMQVQMGRASETREAANADFQQTVVDQRLTQIILQKALKRMKEVYALVQGAPHIQTSGNHTDPGNGPARFTKYEQHAGGSRVVAMIEKVIADSAKMEDEAVAAEQDGQAAYESFMKDSNEAITQSLQTITNMSEERAKAKGALSMAETDFKQTMKELEGLNQVLSDLHGSCDFLLNNFSERQAARAAEIDALREAKAILSGMH